MLTDAQGSAALAAHFSPTFFVPRELSDANPMEFSTPMVYRLSSTPLINPDTDALDVVYYKPTFANEFNALATKETDNFEL